MGVGNQHSALTLHNASRAYLKVPWNVLCGNMHPSWVSNKVVICLSVCVRWDHYTIAYFFRAILISTILSSQRLSILSFRRN